MWSNRRGLKFFLAKSFILGFKRRGKLGGLHVGRSGEAERGAGKGGGEILERV